MASRNRGDCSPARRVGGAFPPEQEEAQRTATLEVLHRAPPEQRGRWTLSKMRAHCPTLEKLKSDGGVSRRLKKWKIGRKRGRLHLLSPDPEFESKQEANAAALALAREQPEAVTLLFGDELTFYRQPQLGRVWFEAGLQQPTAPFVGRANTRRRIVSALDACTGQVYSDSASEMGIRGLCRFLRHLRERLGPHRRIMLVWDNWPVHYHEEVLGVAAQQRIELLHTPTYAPWTNPIEKFWNRLKEQVPLRMHRLSQEWGALREKVEGFLKEHDAPCPDLLRHVGLEIRQEVHPPQPALELPQ